MDMTLLRQSPGCSLSGRDAVSALICGRDQDAKVHTPGRNEDVTDLGCVACRVSTSARKGGKGVRYLQGVDLGPLQEGKTIDGV